MAKTSLQKSHSKVSNAKLTLICLLLAIAFPVCVLGIAMIKDYKTLGIILAAAGGIETLCDLVLINSFKR